MNKLSPPKKPCGSCPYRKDVPAGIWDVSEYEKLRLYDNSTHQQPFGLFMCHQKDGCICGGWLLTHDRDHLLALRLHYQRLDASVWSYAPSIDVFASGNEAAEHGISGIENVSVAAQKKICSIARQRSKNSFTEE